MIYQKLFVLLVMVTVSVSAAQTFAGTYVQDNDPLTTLELQSSAEGYTGLLVDGGEARYRVDAFAEDGLLFGTIYLTEANLAQDLFFGAELMGDRLQLTTALIMADGELDETSYAEYIFFKSSTAAPDSSHLLQVPAPQQTQPPLVNPLAQEAAGTPPSPASSPSDNPLAPTTIPTAEPAGTQTAVSEAGTQAIQAGQVYQAGTALSSAVTGVSFLVPDGFQGGYDQAEGFFLMANQAQTELVLVQAASQLTATQFGQATLQTIANTLDENAVVQEVAAPQQQADRFTASYTINGNFYHLLVRQGAAGNALLVLGIGAESIRQTVERFANAVTFTPPRADTVNTQLGGVSLFSNKTGSYYSPGGVGNGSQASGTKREFTFCSDGSYAYAYSYENYVSVEGAGSISSTDSDSHQGGYLITQSLLGDLVVVLSAQDGRFFVHILEQVPEGVLIDGLLYEVLQSSLCQ